VNGPAADDTYDTVIHLRPMGAAGKRVTDRHVDGIPFCSGRFARGPLHGRAHGESSRDTEVLGPFSMNSEFSRSSSTARRRLRVEVLAHGVEDDRRVSQRVQLGAVPATHPVLHRRTGTPLPSQRRNGPTIRCRNEVFVCNWTARCAE
jgi:hypothetical protein